MKSFAMKYFYQNLNDKLYFKRSNRTFDIGDKFHYKSTITTLNFCLIIICSIILMFTVCRLLLKEDTDSDIYNILEVFSRYL